MSVTVDDANVLRVTGDTQRTGASVSRSYRLPRDADVGNVQASYIDGILTFSIPKTAKNVTQIAVNKAE